MKTILLPFALLFSGILPAQKPSGIPGDTGKLSLDSDSDVILYIIIPVVIIVLYFIWKRNKKKQGPPEN